MLLNASAEGTTFKLVRTRDGSPMLIFQNESGHAVAFLHLSLDDLETLLKALQTPPEPSPSEYLQDVPF